MKTNFTYFTITLLCCILCSCETKKIATQPNDIVNIELSEKEQETMLDIMRLHSLNQTLEWNEVRDGLYINKNGDLGLKTASFRPKKEFIEFYITNFIDEAKSPLKDVIDAKSFKLIAGYYPYGAYYKDKNHIYHYFITSDGGQFNIVEGADYNTFENLNDCFARDKNNVYDIRLGLMKEVDAATFKFVSENRLCLGKDKNGYYSNYSKLSEEQLADQDIQKLKKKLDRK